MKKAFLFSLVSVASVAIIISFFLPWATIATSVTGISKGLTGALSDTPVAGKVVGEISRVTDVIGDLGGLNAKSTVSGYDIPIMVNNKSSKVALSLTQIFFKSAEGVDKKSYLVYLLPILGIGCGALAFFGTKNNLYVIAMSALSGVVAVVGLFKLYTMDISSTVVKISIMQGLWYTMYSFLFISTVGIVYLIADKKDWGGAVK